MYADRVLFNPHCPWEPASPWTAKAEGTVHRDLLQRHRTPNILRCRGHTVSVKWVSLTSNIPKSIQGVFVFRAKKYKLLGQHREEAFSLNPLSSLYAIHSALTLMTFCKYKKNWIVFLKMRQNSLNLWCWFHFSSFIGRAKVIFKVKNIWHDYTIVIAFSTARGMLSKTIWFISVESFKRLACEQTSSSGWGKSWSWEVYAWHLFLAFEQAFYKRIKNR